LSRCSHSIKAATIGLCATRSSSSTSHAFRTDLPATPILPGRRNFVRRWLRVTVPDPNHSVDELRFVAVGLSNQARLCLTPNARGIISARKLTREERMVYETTGQQHNSPSRRPVLDDDRGGGPAARRQQPPMLGFFRFDLAFQESHSNTTGSQSDTSAATAKRRYSEPLI